MDWLNRVGIVLNFLSFWLAAPELLGQARLQQYENAIEKALRRTRVPRFFLATGLLALWGVTFAREFLPASIFDLDWRLQFIAVGVVCIPFYSVYQSSEKYIEEILLPSLADDTKIRQRALRAGIWTFIIGNVLQIVATF